MKFSTCIKSWCVALILLISTPIAADGNMSQEALANMYNELNAIVPDKVSDAFAEEVEGLINQVNCMFGDLACLVQEDAIRIEDKDQKSELLKAITQTRTMVNKVLKEFINKPTKAQLNHTLHVVNAIMEQLEQALKGDFTTYKPFDPEEVATRSVDTRSIDDEALIQQFENTKDYCKEVQKSSENAGLFWYNHLYRNTFDRYIVRPCDKYNLHGKALYSAAGLAAFTFLWYQLNTSLNGCAPEDICTDLDPNIDLSSLSSVNQDDHIVKQLLGTAHDKVNYLVRHHLGWPPYTQAVINNGTAKPVYLYGKLEELGHRVANSWCTPFMMMYGLFKDDVNAKYKETKSVINKYVQLGHNCLKGGAYYQRFKFKKTQGRIEPRFTFDEVIGLDHAKNVLNDIIEYIQDPERYERAGLTPAMGYLLFGPTRTGKSMLAEALAGELQKIKGSSDNFPFFSIQARYIASEGSFDYVMSLIKNYAPCIIFIDEIDMLSLHRKFKDKNVLLSEFLSTISGCMSSDPDKQVIILAATNEPDDLDPALRSRLSVHIPFEYPAFAHRAESIIRELEGKGLPLEQFDIRKLAEQTEGCSHEDLHKIINKAQFLSRKTGKPITQADVERSLNTEVHNIIYHDYKDLSQEELDTLSIHMAGHALAYTLIEGKSEQFSQVTIRPVKSKNKDESDWKEIFADQPRPIIQYGHIFTHLNGDSLKFMSKNDIKRKCMIELAGRIAEEVVLGTYFVTKDSCSAHDKARAFHWAKCYFLDGLDERLFEGSKAMQNKIVEQAYEFVTECENELRVLFGDHKKLIAFLADGLKKFETFGADEIAAMIDLHNMMGDKSIEEFVKELEQQAAAQQQQGNQGTSSEDRDTAELTEDEIRTAMHNELDIQEVPTAA